MMNLFLCLPLDQEPFSVRFGSTLVNIPMSIGYPLSTLPEQIHSTILSYRQNYLKTHTQTMETSFHPPLTLVSLLANYPHSHYSPPHWGSHLHTPLYSHSIFWRLGCNVSRAVSCTFVLFAFVLVPELPVFIMPLS